MIKRLLVSAIALMLVCCMLASCDISSLGLSGSYIPPSASEDATNAAKDEVTTDSEGNEWIEKLNEQTPFQVYSQFNQKLEDVSSNCTVTTTSDVHTKIEIAGQKVNSQTKIEIVVKSNGDNCYSKTTTVTKTKGETVESVMEVWYVDGVIYTQMDKQKIKMTVSADQAYELVYGEKKSEESKIIEIPESWFEDVSFKVEKNGTYVMDSDMNGDRMEEAMSRLGIANDMGLEIKNIKYKYKVDKNGMIVGSEGKYAMSIESSSYSASADGKMNAVYSDFGTTEEITLPEDADAYVEVTYEQIFGNK